MSITQQNPNPISLLCVDDDVWILETLQKYFEDEPDIRLQTSSSAMEALYLLNSQHFDAIMCDYSMPDMDGVTLLREIRSRGDNAIFIIFTGRRLAHVAIDTLNNGGNYYLQKGVDVLHEMPKLIGYIKSHRNAERTPDITPRPESPLYSLFEKQLDPVCCFDREGIYQYTSQSFINDIFPGKTKSGTEGFFTTIPEDKRDEILTRLTSLTAESPGTHIEHLIRTADGSHKLYLWNYRAIADDAGEITGYTAQGTNLSDIVRFPVKTPRTDNPYYSLVENQSDPVCCFDTNGKFLYKNRSFKRDIPSGKTQGESEGFFTTIPGDMRQDILAKLRSLSVLSPVTRLEHSIRTADGSDTPYVWNYRAIADKSGEITGYTAQGTKLSEIVRLSLPALPSDNPYYSLVENLSDPVCCFDPDGKYLYKNRSFKRDILSGKAHGESEGFFLTIPADTRSEIRTRLTSLSMLTPAARIEHPLRMADGSDIPYVWNYRAITDEIGDITGYTAQGTNISEIVRRSSPIPAPATGAAAAPHDVEPVMGEGIPPRKKKRADISGSLIALADSVEDVPYPIFAIDITGKILAWNPAMEGLTGISAEEIIGKDEHAYALALYGDSRSMLIDYIFYSPEEKEHKKTQGITRDGDVFTGDPETVTIQGKTMQLWSKGAGIYDADGYLIAAVQSILVSSELSETVREGSAEEETYLGGISSIVIKVTGSGIGGAIAGALGSSVGGYGVYATNKRLLVIHNPTLDARRNDSIEFGTFIIDELFGTTVDTRTRQIRDLEVHKVFEVWREDIFSIELKKPRLLAGYLILKMAGGDSFKVYIDHNKAFVHLEQLLTMFYPELLVGSTEPPLPASIKSAPVSAARPESMTPVEWKDLADSMNPVPYPIFAIDRWGYVIAWNRAIETLTGINAPDMIGKGDHAYAVPFYGVARSMLIDYIVMPPDAQVSGEMPAITRDGDIFIGDLEHVSIRQKPMMMWGKGTGIYDNSGSVIAAIQSIMVSDPATQPSSDGVSGVERYLGGISSITVKLGGEGMSGTIAGALGSTTGGYGVYATDQRLFVIHNPELDATRSDGISFGRFIIDELFGSTVDTRARMIEEIERHKVIEIRRSEITGIEMKNPMLLAGYIIFRTRNGEVFTIYIDHQKAFTHIHQLLRLFYPEILRN